MAYSFDSQNKEKKVLERLKRKQPDLFKRDPQIEGARILEFIGIDLPRAERPLGYIRLYPHDFIVEEIGSDGHLSTVDLNDQTMSDQESTTRTENKTIFADLIKVGLSTLDAKKRIADTLGVPEDAVNYAGIKDAAALTAQRISIRKTDIKKIKELTVPGLFLKNFQTGKGIMTVGNLKGNRFTLFVRIRQIASPINYKKRFKDLAASGFWNFYWLQRFGGRTLAHWWGKLILQGNYQAAVKSFLTESGPRDIPLFEWLRREAEALYPDWRAMHELFTPFSFSMRYELSLIKHLITHPDDLVGALNKIPDQIRLWIYAYMSYLVNRKLSRYANGVASCPSQISLPLGTESTKDSFYAALFRADKISRRYKKFLQPFPLIFLRKRKLPTRIRFKLHKTETVPQGVGMSFDLPKGAYATAMLGQVFTLVQGEPVPAWVSKKDFDTKQLLEAGGGLGPVKEKLADHFYNKKTL